VYAIGLGFNYANKHRKNILGIVSFEAMVQVSSWKDMNEAVRPMFKKFKT